MSRLKTIAHWPVRGCRGSSDWLSLTSVMSVVGEQSADRDPAVSRRMGSSSSHVNHIPDGGQLVQETGCEFRLLLEREQIHTLH